MTADAKTPEGLIGVHFGPACHLAVMLAEIHSINLTYIAAAPASTPISLAAADIRFLRKLEPELFLCTKAGPAAGQSHTILQ